MSSILVNNYANYGAAKKSAGQNWYTNFSVSSAQFYLNLGINQLGAWENRGSVFKKVANSKKKNAIPKKQTTKKKKKTNSKITTSKNPKQPMEEIIPQSTHGKIRAKRSMAKEKNELDIEEEKECNNDEVPNDNDQFINDNDCDDNEEKECKENEDDELEIIQDKENKKMNHCSENENIATIMPPENRKKRRLCESQLSLVDDYDAS